MTNSANLNADIRTTNQVQEVMEDIRLNEITRRQKEYREEIEENDPRVLALKKEQEELEHKLKLAEQYKLSLEKGIHNLKIEAEKADSYFSLRWDDEDILKRIEEDKKLLESQTKRANELREQLKASKDILEKGLDLEVMGKILVAEANDLKAQGKLLESDTKIKEAQDNYNQAQINFGESYKAIGDKSSIDKSAMRRNIKAQAKITDEQIKGFETWESIEDGTRYVVDTAIVIGATVAATAVVVAAAPVIGVAGAVVLGVGAATAYGTGVGYVTSETEAIMDASLGNKSWTEAQKDAKERTQKLATESLIGGLGGAIGGGVVVKVLGKAASKASAIFAGKIGGAASSVAVDTVNTSINIVKGTEKREWHHVAMDTLSNGVIAYFSGGVGARAGQAKQAMGFLGKVGVTGAQLTAEAAIGVAGTFANTNLQNFLNTDDQDREYTKEDAIKGAWHAIWTGLIGELVSQPGGGIPKESVSGTALAKLATTTSTDVSPSVTVQTKYIENVVARDMPDQVVKDLNITQEAKVKTAETAALNTARALSNDAQAHGSDYALNNEHGEAVSKKHMKSEVGKLLDEHNATKVVEKETTKLLEAQSKKTVKEIQQELEANGLATGKAAKQHAKEIHENFKKGKLDQEIKDTLISRTTDKVTAHLEADMEGPWKNKFKKALKGEVEGEEFQKLREAVEERAKKLKKSVDELIDELTEAGWRGARRGIREAVEERVRIGVDRALTRFRKKSGFADSFIPSADEPEEHRNNHGVRDDMSSLAYANSASVALAFGKGEKEEESTRGQKVTHRVEEAKEGRHKIKRTFRVVEDKEVLEYTQDLGKEIEEEMRSAAK